MNRILAVCMLYLAVISSSTAQFTGQTKDFQVSENLSIAMVWIAPGKFMMGSPTSEPERNAEREKLHPVTHTKGFWMAKTETTQQVWKTVMANNPSKIKGEKLPIESISWDEVQQFINKLNEAGAKFRLPYEAEWEYACRAGTSSPYADDRDSMTWHYGNANETTHPVGTKKPNPWGLYDMHGNVLEMCQDWFTEDISSYKLDPKGPQNGTRKVQRGGQYTGRIRHSRAADRQAGLPGESAFFMGFRLVHD